MDIEKAEKESEMKVRERERQIKKQSDEIEGLNEIIEKMRVQVAAAEGKQASSS